MSVSDRMRFSSVVLFAGLISGCGGGGDVGRVSVVPVKGTVFLDDQSHTSGTVTLTPVRSGEVETRPVISGKIQSDGTFTVTTYEEGDGGAPGEYTAALGGAADGSSTDPADMMAMMGGGVSTAPLTASIPPEGTDSLELRFTSTKKKAAAPNAPLGTP